LAKLQGEASASAALHAANVLVTCQRPAADRQDEPCRQSRDVRTSRYDFVESKYAVEERAQPFDDVSIRVVCG